MNIGGLKLNSNLILAPMAGVNCTAFRLLCHEYGAGLVSTPMIVTNQLVASPQKIIDRTCFLKEEKPISVQLVGSDPILAAEATKIIEDYADVIDLNMGCPERDILALKAGSFLVKHPEQMEKAMELLKEIGTQNPSTEENVLVSFNDFGASALGLLFIYYIRKDEDILVTQSAINLEIKRKFEEHKLEMAYPTQTIYTRQS